MTQVTIRRMEKEWVEKAKAKGVFHEYHFLDAIKRDFGLDGQPHTNGLEELARTCPKGLGAEFDEAMKDCSRIDLEDWK